MALQGTTYTLADLVDDLSLRVQDTGDSRWSESLKQLAVQTAVRDAAPHWWEERVDAKHEYDYTDFRYSLPAGCDVVEEVRFEPTSSTKPRQLVIPGEWHLEADELVFEDSFTKYNGYTLYIIYLHYQYNLLDVSGDSGEVDSTGLTFTDTGETWIADGVKAGDAIIIDGDGTYFIEEVTDSDELTLRTEATEDTGLDYTIAYYTDMPQEYLLNQAMSELYMVALRNRPGVEITQSIKLSDYHRQLAAQALDKNRKRPRARRRY